MRLPILPARRAFVTAAIILFLLYYGYAYFAIAAAVLFLISWWLFPVKQAQDFFISVVPAIDSLAAYLRQVNQKLKAPHQIRESLQLAEYAVFKVFFDASVYPEWVYRSGFNRSLRSGFRYFLIQLEHAADLCNSIGFWLSQYPALNDKTELLDLLRQSLKVNIDLLAGLSRTMHHHAEKTLRPVNDANVDFVSDMIALEGAMQRLVPASIELLDMSEDYIYTTAVVRAMKDLREALLALVAAVPVK